MKKKLLMLVLTAVMTASCVACTSKTPSNKVVESTETKKEVKAQNIKAEDLTPLSDKGVISGVKDMTVAEGTKVNLNELVYADKTLVKSVDVDDSKVDYSKAGTYEVVYTITFNGDKLRDYIKSNNLTVSFDTTGDTVVVKTTVTVTVATKEDADAAIANGDTSVVTEETKAAVQKENKAKANDNAVESKPTPNQSNSSKKNDSSSGNSNSGNNGSTDKPQQHTHNYVEVSRTNATCTAAGSITKKCSCGDVITVPNGNALGHDMVHHDATTHPEQHLVKAAWTETIYSKRYVCNGCGAQFKTDDEALDHIMATDITSACQNYSLKKVATGTVQHEAQYETIQVSNNDAYDACSRCGYRQ